jgi:hypothetical protein
MEPSRIKTLRWCAAAIVALSMLWLMTRQVLAEETHGFLCVDTVAKGTPGWRAEIIQRTDGTVMLNDLNGHIDPALGFHEAKNQTFVLVTEGAGLVHISSIVVENQALRSDDRAVLRMFKMTRNAIHGGYAEPTATGYCSPVSRH